MKINGLKLSALIVALGTASLFSQETKKTAPPPPPVPQALDAQTLAARRAVILNRVALSRAARAAEHTNKVAQGAPGAGKGLESGGQTSASTQPGPAAGQGATAATTAPSVERPRGVRITPAPATVGGAK